MKFLVYAHSSSTPMQERLGAVDYSYIFLLKTFSMALAGLGEVINVEDPAQADEIFVTCVAAGERCVLLSFVPPYKTPLLKHCPVVPVFAWEYPDIPERIEEHCWEGDPRHDWRYVFSVADRAIALSEHSARVVKRSMGATYPIVAIPAPLTARPASRQFTTHDPVPEGGVLLELEASAVDSRVLGLDANGLDLTGKEDETPWHESDDALLPASKVEVPEEGGIAPLAEDELPMPPCGWEVPQPQQIRTRLRGVVYTSVLTPASGRKNWVDMITAFCWAFKDNPNATLILKVAGKDLDYMHNEMLMNLTKASPIKCRIIAIHGYISGEAYRNLMNATTYYLNTSLCEGLCLPLLEYLGSGVPAIAPDNTAMADYIDDELAFVVDSYPGIPSVWPHGDWDVNRTTFQELDWESLLNAFLSSYDLAMHDADGYHRMAQAARNKIMAYCGMDVVRDRLQEFLCPDTARPQNDPDEPIAAGDVGP